MYNARMNQDNIATEQSTSQSTGTWNYQPDSFKAANPLFQLPPKLLKIISWYYHSWKPASENSILLLFARITFFWLQPTQVVGQLLDVQTIALMYVRNITYIFILAGGLHYYFYIAKAQGETLKYEKRQFSKDKKYTFNDQVWDNMFWTLASGVTIWTAYEVLLLNLYATGYMPQMQWGQNPIWFIAWLLLIPSWVTVHFYFVHRFLHWGFMYKYFHSLHHRNINVGPWSGISMHPVEHLLYLSSLLIHFIIPSHPIHIFYHVYALTLSPAFGHAGYDAILFKGRELMILGRFHHQLHHRHFECNYGSPDVPVDIWLDTFDDGTPEARKHLRKKALEKMKATS